LRVESKKGRGVYIVTAWNGAEHVVRCEDPREALDHAKEFVAKGKKVSIVKTASGEAVGVNELQAAVEEPNKR
jgi:hypothetical protein